MDEYEIKSADGIGEYYTSDDLDRIMTLKEKDHFLNWMYGQTVCIIDAEVAYYGTDVRRFMSNVRFGKPTYFD